MPQRDWKEALQDIRREVAPVTELRNEREITRAVQYAEGELKTHLELSDNAESRRLIVEALLKVVQNIGLGQTGTELSKSIDDLLGTFEALDQAAADLVEGSKVQATEFFEELESLRGSVLPPITLSEISVELRRRAEWGESKGQEQEELQNRYDAIKGNLDVSRQTLKFQGFGSSASEAKKIISQLEDSLSTLERSIQAIIDRLKANRREMAILEGTKKALEIARDGWRVPRELIGKDLD